MGKSTLEIKPYPLAPSIFIALRVTNKLPDQGKISLDLATLKSAEQLTSFWVDFPPPCDMLFTPLFFNLCPISVRGEAFPPPCHAYFSSPALVEGLVT